MRVIRSVLPLTPLDKFSPYLPITHFRWNEANTKLEANLCDCMHWADLDIDENFENWQISLTKFEEIEKMLKEADAMKIQDPQITLFHVAARHNLLWVISQFLKDKEHINPLVCDGSGKTPYDITIDYGFIEATQSLMADERIANYLLSRDLQVHENETQVEYFIRLIRSCDKQTSTAFLAETILLQELSQLKELNFAHIPLTQKDIALLVMILAKNPKIILPLEQITLTGNRLSDEELTKLHPLFQAASSTLQRLVLTDNQISDVGSYWLGKILLPECKKLFLLDLKGNILSKTGYDYLNPLCNEQKILLYADSSFLIPSLPPHPKKSEDLNVAVSSPLITFLSAEFSQINAKLDTGIQLQLTTGLEPDIFVKPLQPS